MSAPILYPYQGQQFDRVLQIRNLDGTAATSTFTVDSVLTASVWLGQNQAVLFTPVVAWFTDAATQTGYDQGQVSLSIAGTQTAALDPAGEYWLLISETTSGLTSPVIETRVKILATPGTTSPSPPDLATYDYVESLLTRLDITDSERDMMPYLITSASNLIRRFCFGRNFDMRTYVESYDVALDGTVRLFQVPVNQVTRVQGVPGQALTVTQTSSSVQFAQAIFAYTGQFDGFGTNAQTITGMTLNWTSNGVATSTTIPFTSGMTIAALATAINVVDNGWRATADTVLGLWPALELVGGYLGQGAGPTGGGGGSGAIFNVLLDLNTQQISNQATGILWVGRQYRGLGPRWGPDWAAFDDGSSSNLGRVKVSYVAGYTTIPSAVQLACAELVEAQIERLRTDFYLISEKADKYSYELDPGLMDAIPKAVRQGLAPYRLHYA